MKVVTVVGARPQFIKAAALSPALADAGISEVLVHTGQHYDDDMSAVFFRELGLPDPAYNLGVGSMSHGQQTGRMLTDIEGVLQRERPDALVVFGDTNSTLAAALAASKLGVPVAHVEAGLRSFDRAMPEEQNRVLTDHVSDWLFVPTAAATRNLRREGITRGVHEVGDVMIDAVKRFAPIARQRALSLPESYVLATVHRAATTDSPALLAAVVEGLRSAGESTPIVLPLHPRTRHALERDGLLDSLESGVQVLPPLGYLDMLAAIDGASAVITDSGGLQKEAWALGRPVVTLRAQTEWVELVSAGWNLLLAPEDARGVRDALQRVLQASKDDAELYGGGQASMRIAEALLHGARRPVRLTPDER